MRDLITLIETANGPGPIYIKASSWEALPEFLLDKYPSVKLASDRWGMCGSQTRVWPKEFDPNRWPGQESELRNNSQEAHDALINALKYVTPKEYRDKIRPRTTMYFKIDPVLDNDGKVTGGYVEVVQGKQKNYRNNIPNEEPVVDMDAYYKELEELERQEEIKQQELEKNSKGNA